MRKCYSLRPTRYIPSSKLPMIAKAGAGFIVTRRMDWLTGDQRAAEMRFRSRNNFDACGWERRLPHRRASRHIAQTLRGPGQENLSRDAIGHEDSPIFRYIFGNVQPACTTKLLTFPGDYIKDTSLAPFEFAFPARVLSLSRVSTGRRELRWRLSIPTGFAKVALLGKIHNALNPDLSRFKKHGGKLIIFNGGPILWCAMRLSSIERVQAAMGDTQIIRRDCSWRRHDHCGGGRGRTRSTRWARWKNGLTW